MKLSRAPESLPLGPDARLARLDANDAEPLFARIGEERGELSRFLPWILDIHTGGHMRAHVDEALARVAADEERTWVVWAASEALGMVSLARIDHQRASASIGLWLARSARGQGLGARAASEVMTWAFHAAGLRRLDYRCAEDNLASQRLATDLGFRFEGAFFEADPPPSAPRAQVAFGLLAREWPAAREGREAAPIRPLMPGDHAALGPLEALGSLTAPGDVRLTAPERGAIVCASDLAFAEIQGFAVAPGEASPRVAARLLAAAEARLREAGVALVFVDVPLGAPKLLRTALTRRGYLPIAEARWVRAVSAPIAPENQ